MNTRKVPRRHGSRDRLTIMMQILEHLAYRCSKPSRMSTELNLAYDRLMELLKYLEGLNLVRRSNNGYCITHRGLMLVEEYRRFIGMFESSLMPINRHSEGQAINLIN